MAFHDRRVWTVADAESSSQLAYDLTQRSWALCQGFRLGGYLFLNDALSEDGAQEYAVVRESDRVQVESITFGWIDDAERAEGYIRQALAGFFDDARLAVLRPEQIETGEQHGRCPLCA